ncbi:fimbrial protein [Pantoea sp. C2G6]|uniref:fimbrial protein n=1 Tax=Pantoea sp. C2G6 TaxID=3243084 RepID=UPI003ED9816D
MRFFLVYLIPLAVLSLVSSASAADQGHGTVHVQGSIMDTPCAIASGSRYQSVDLSALPVSTIISDGVGPSKPFTINLSNCLLQRSLKDGNDWSTFAITFDGKVTGNGLFGVEGEASGVGIEITDKAGNIAAPGKVMPEYALEPDSMDLGFNLRLKANQKAVRPGNYQSTIRFKMDYY